MSDIVGALIVTAVFAWLCFKIRAPSSNEQHAGALRAVGGPLVRTGWHLIQLLPPFLVLVAWLNALGWLGPSPVPVPIRWLQTWVVSTAYVVAAYRWWQLNRRLPEPTIPGPGSLSAESRWQHLGRLVALSFAVEICSVGLYGWVLLRVPVADAVRSHFPDALAGTPLRLGGAMFVAGFVYGQLVSGAFVTGLREGVATWGTPRGWQYVASAFPVVIGFTLCVPGLSEGLWGEPAAPSLAAGLGVRAVLLLAGYLLTLAPPAGTFRTLRDIAGTQRLGSAARASITGQHHHEPRGSSLR